MAVCCPGYCWCNCHSRDRWSSRGSAFLHFVGPRVSGRCHCCADRRGGRLGAVASARSRAAGACPGTLELESGINDPLSVLLTILLVGLLLAPVPLTGSHIAALLAREVVGGGAFGIIGGYLLLALINRVEATPGLYPILALAG